LVKSFTTVVKLITGYFFKFLLQTWLHVKLFYIVADVPRYHGTICTVTWSKKKFVLFRRKFDEG